MEITGDILHSQSFCFSILLWSFQYLFLPISINLNSYWFASGVFPKLITDLPPSLLLGFNVTVRKELTWNSSCSELTTTLWSSKRKTQSRWRALGSASRVRSQGTEPVRTWKIKIRKTFRKKGKKSEKFATFSYFTHPNLAICTESSPFSSSKISCKLFKGSPKLHLFWH